MKLNINKNIKKGFYLAGLSLMCMAFSGCSEKNRDTTEVVADFNYDACTKFEIATAPDTQAILDAYNSELRYQKLTVDDLEYLSQFSHGVYSIKREDGTYTQIGMDYRLIDDSDNHPVITLDLNTGPVKVININTGKTFYKVFEKYDALTGDKIDREYLRDKAGSSVLVGDYVKKNNISMSGYTFPMNRFYNSTNRETVLQKYGQEVLNCVEKYGFPMKMYEAKDFKHKVKSMTKH